MNLTQPTPNSESADNVNSLSERSKIAISASRLIQRAALFCVALATVMTVALFAGWAILTRFVPATPGIVLDTALGIFLAGAGLWLAQRKKFMPVRIIAAFLLPVGTLNFFVRNPKFALHSHVFPGFADRPSWPTWPQMAQGTGIALALLAISLFLVARAKPSILALRLTAFLGTVVASLGLVTLLAYAAGLNAVPWWGSTFLFDMAIPTALACTVMGVALVGFFWQEAEGDPHQLAVTSALLSIFCLLLLVAGADASLWTNTSVILTNRAASRVISDELFATYALVDSVRRAEAGQHSYLLTGDEEYLKNFSLGMQEFSEITGQHSVHDADLLAAIQLEVDGLRRTVALEQGGKHAEAIRLAKALEGRRLMEQIEQRAASVTSDLQQHWDSRKNTNTRSVFSIRTTILWSYAMIILLACCALWLVAKEISRRTRIEGDLRTSKVLLGRIVAELREETARAEDANRAKSNFLAAMSHEIRTPMTAILGMAELLWESELSHTQRHYLEVFKRTGAHLLNLVNGLLDLSKIESGTFVLEAAVFDVREMAEQVVETLTPKAEAKGIALVASIASTTITGVVGDSERLQQVLLNLLGNAIKFTAAGQVVLKVSSSASSTGDELLASLSFEVSDTGIGIAASELSNIFEDFKQAPSTSTRFGGTGLGLGISRGLVRLMGGDIQVRSEVGAGSTFSFKVELPIDVQLKNSAPAQLQQVAGKKVLLVDDVAVNREVLREMLAGLGMAVTSCASGAEAIELATVASQGEPFAVALINKAMPSLDGFQTASRILRLRAPPSVFIISSDNRGNDVERVRELGLAGHLMKPIRRVELLREIAKAVSGISTPALPAVKGPAVPPKTGKSVLSQERIPVLIAEDSEDNRFLLEAYCQETAYDLTFAEDGEQAVAAYRSRAFALVVMDVQMPVMDGLTAARQIRLLESARGPVQIPILAFTANALSADVARSREAGCDAHLVKPISKQAFLNALAQWQAHGVSSDIPTTVN